VAAPVRCRIFTRGTESTEVGVLVLLSLVRPEGAVCLWVEVPPKPWSVRFGSWQAVCPGNWAGWSPATKVAFGDRASGRAVTRVKPEQASKGKLWTPTRPEIGEGRADQGSSRQEHLVRSTGVSGMAPRYGRDPAGRRSPLQHRFRRWFGRKSERVMVPLKPGNAGGGKSPDFWRACEDSKDW
jgi:hypothetical protein